jgi:hypothetical protein
MVVQFVPPGEPWPPWVRPCADPTSAGAFSFPRPAAKADSPIARPPRSSAPAGPRTGRWPVPSASGPTPGMWAPSPGSALRPRRGRGGGL